MRLADGEVEAEAIARGEARLEAVERARTTGEPTLVEVVTYRFRGHSMSDPGLYRTKEEVEEWRRRDPLNKTRARLLELGMAEAEIEALENEPEP